MLTFPSKRFDDLSLLLTTIPKFWTNIYDGKDLVIDFLRGIAAQERQIDQLADELYDSVGRQTCPLLHTWLWLPITIAESSLVQTTPGSPSTTAWAFPVSPDTVDCQLATDSVVEPSVIQTSGLDFVINTTLHRIEFTTNPFADYRFQPYTESGLRYLRIYLFSARSDWQYMQQIWGSALSIMGPSTDNYGRLINAMFDGISGGASIGNVMRVLSLISDIPLAAGNETVQEISADSDNMLIITDQNVYKFNSSANPTVAVGTVLKTGQTMTDGLQMQITNRGQIPAGMTSLTVDLNFLWSGISGPLTFLNQNLPLTVVGVVNGFTKVTFPITGAGGDVTAFFTEMHTRGVAAGKALANYLDLRASPSSQPIAVNLPTTVNPLQLLLSSALRNNLLLVLWNSGQFGPNNLGAEMVSAVRKIISPHTGLLLIDTV